MNDDLDPERASGPRHCLFKIAHTRDFYKTVHCKFKTGHCQYEDLRTEVIERLHDARTGRGMPILVAELLDRDANNVVMWWHRNLPRLS